MRKKSTRLLSAALAACMMLSALPVGAFAAEPGTEPENTVTAQEEAHILQKSGDRITSGGTYTMEGGPYTGTITVDVEDGEDVIINITGDVTTNVSTMLIKVLKGHVTINGGNATVRSTNVKVEYSFVQALIGLSGTDENTTVEINGGTYIMYVGAAAGCDRNSKGTLIINSGTFETKMRGAVENYADKSAVMRIEGGTFIGLEPFERCPDSYALVNYGTTIINNGDFSCPHYCIKNDGGGDLYIHGGTFKGGSSAVYGEQSVRDQTLTITGGDFKATEWKGKETNVLYAGNGKLNVTGGTFEGTGEWANAITTLAPSATIENVTLKVNASVEGAGICVRVGSKYPELKKVTFENTGSADDYGDLKLYNVQPGTYEFNLTEDFTSMAVVKAWKVSKELKVTMETNSHYQKDLKLVSADPEYIIDYQKNDNGTEYRYFNTREADKYYVNPINATMTADGEEKRPYSQFAQGDKVTLTAFSNDEGKKFTGWKVEKIAAEGVEDVSEKVNIVSEDPENPETATLTMPNYDIFVTAEYEDVIIDPGTGDDDYGGDIAAGVVIGGIAAVGAYEVGTGLYRITQMDDVAMPTNRLALAKLMWERAGKPEPESTALYSDISAEDTDAQKAARWAVEQELLKDDTSEDEQKFHPAFPVSKLRVCLTWEKAKQKGLFDQNTEA